MLTYAKNVYETHKTYLDECAARNGLIFEQLPNGDYYLRKKNG